MDTTQQMVIARLNLYKTDPNAWQWIKEREKDKEFGVWARVVAQHFESEMLPRLKESHETLVEFFQAQFLWGEGTHYRSGVTTDRVYHVKSGLFSTGYFCLTTENLYIVSFAELTRKFPLIESGFISSVLLGVLGVRDEREAFQKDGFGKNPLGSIRDVQIVESNESVEHLVLITDVRIWNLFVVNDLSFTLEAINMARFNQLEDQGDEPNGRDTFSKEHVAKLQRLKELFDSGLITHGDYDAKRLEILSHL